MGIDSRRFIEVPHAAVYLLIAANIIVFALCLRQAGSEAIPGEILFRSGAMYTAALERGEYWRLVACGFLHANLFHLATNMLCLALWGAHLEKRIGPFFFLVVYFCALIAGAVVGTFTHAGPYLSVGASGGISGVLGALLCLWILGKIDLTADFFVVNLGLNAALAVAVRNIDWGAHFGGFAAGLIVCALIDLAEKANRLLLRCKFPEFVKINAFIVIGGVALLAWDDALAPSSADAWWPLVALLVTAAVVIKACDLLLSVKKGLAILVLLFAVGNAALVLHAGSVFAPALRSACIAARVRGADGIGGVVIGAACASLAVTLMVAAALAFVATLVVCWQPLERGMSDVGFIDATLRAERRRRHGI